MTPGEVGAALGRRVERVSVLGGGYANATYAVTGPDLSAVLRVYVRDPTRRDMELALLSRVGSTVPVPEILWSGEVGGSPAMLMSRVDGVLLEEVLATGSAADIRSAGQAVGAALAPLHEISFDRPGFLDACLSAVRPAGTAPDDLRAYARSQLLEGEAGKVLGAELRDAWWAIIDDAAPRLSRVDGVAQLVHADYNGKNVLVVRDNTGWRVSAVLDWEFAFAGPPLTDVGNMLRLPAPQGFSDAFTHGYRSAGGRLDSDWREVAATLDVFGLLGLLRPGSGLVDRVTELVRTQVRRGTLWP